MVKKAKVAAAAAASVVGMSVAVAIGNDSGPTVSNGAEASSLFGDSATRAL
ncbi:hypothetical protein [Streptomyces sp. NPDC056165]|uniref:hypothetical protein n=1 Tax=Streptomyces sp. NPDC056165 TaxID=3345733 RepID=UPI0035E29EB6